jgi:SRSO17 transposase
MRANCGTVGKLENGQVGVFTGYALWYGYALMDKRLFLLEAWCTDADATRRTRGNVPTELPCQSKPQLAVAMLKSLVREGLLPCKYVVADGLYGNSPDFLEAVDACVVGTTFMAIPADTRCWLQRTKTTERTCRYQGKAGAKRMVVAPANDACTVVALATPLPASTWYRRQVVEGPKGRSSMPLPAPR